MNTVPLRILIELRDAINQAKHDYTTRNTQVSSASMGKLSSVNARLEVWLEDMLKKQVEVTQ